MKINAEQLRAAGLSEEQIAAVTNAAKRPRKARAGKGNRPPDAVGLLIDGMSLRRDGSPEHAGTPLYGWRLYLRPEVNPGWLNLKLVRRANDSGGPGNYWLGWHIADKRFAHSNYSTRLPDDIRSALEHFFDDDLPRGDYGKYHDPPPGIGMSQAEFYASILADADANDLLT
jgi:hypothetical protein